MSESESMRRYQLIPSNLQFARYEAEDGVKRFELAAEEIRQLVVGGVWMQAWGYNGSTPGPLIVVHEHERVQVQFHNHLPEATAIHWNGLVVPNDVDGMPMMGGASHVPAGESHLYDFTARTPGTYLYHAHVLNARQQMMGLTGMFIVLPLEREPIDRDYTIILQDWCLESPTSALLNPEQLNWANKNSIRRVHRVKPGGQNYNYFTLNGKAFPNTAPLMVREGERIRLRIANMGMMEHPMHLHGHDCYITAMDGCPLRQPIMKRTVNVAPGETVDVQFVANNPGVWAFHCSNPQHTMNAFQNGGGMMTTVRYLDWAQSDEKT